MPRADTPPALPWVARQLALPLNRIPGQPVQKAVIALLNQVFATAIAVGDLAFFAGQSLRIQIDDIRFGLQFYFDGRTLLVPPADSHADVSLCGDVGCFMLMLSRREDPDTLFFQRRLRIEGNVELGLGVKNFLDAWERPYSIEKIEWLCGLNLDILARLTRYRD